MAEMRNFKKDGGAVLERRDHTFRSNCRFHPKSESRPDIWDLIPVRGEPG